MRLPSLLFVASLLLSAPVVGALEPSPAPTPVAAPPVAEAPASPKGPNYQKVADVQKIPVDQFVYLQAKIVSVSPPRPNSRQPYGVFLADATGSIRLAIFQDTWASMKNTEAIKPGAWCDVYAKTSKFQGTPQLDLAKATHFRLTPGREAEEVSISAPGRIADVSIAHLGMSVSLTGTVRAVNSPASPKAPYKVTLNDDGKDMTVVYWKEVATAISPEAQPAEGARLTITGMVTEFKGKMQLRVDAPEGFVKASAQ